MKKRIIALTAVIVMAVFGASQPAVAFDFFGLLPDDAKKLKKKAEKEIKKYKKLLKGKKSKKKKKEGNKTKKGKPTEKGKKTKLIYVDNIDSGIEQAKKLNRKILIIISSESCPPCRAMKKQVYPKTKVRKAMKNYVIVTDGKTSGVKGHADYAYMGSQGKQLEGEPGLYYTPSFGVFDKNGKLIRKNIGSMDEDGFLKFLK